MLSDEMKRVRTERGLGMTKVAQRSGLSRAHLYALENGQRERPYVDTLIKLAKGLAIWRDGEPDDADWGNIFRSLERASGYPGETAEEVGSVPAELEGRLRQISENWGRLGGQERSVVDQLLRMASSFCPSPEATVVPVDSRTTEMKHSNNFALYLDRMGPDPSRVAPAPVRELAFAGA